MDEKLEENKHSEVKYDLANVHKGNNINNNNNQQHQPTENGEKLHT